MRVNDLKQILWWLSGGLVICIGVLVAVMFFLKPSKPNYRQYGLYGDQQMSRARKPDRDRRMASLGFEKTYGSTFNVKINGIEPPRPVETEKPVEAKINKRDLKLAEFIDVVALWTNVAFYRLKNNNTKVEEVEVGEKIPAQQVPEFEGNALLARIEFKDSPFRAIFEVNGREEVFLIAQDAVLLARAKKPPAAVEVYRGPEGGVRPLERTLPPSGIRLNKDDNSVVFGRDVASNYNQLLKDVAWDVAPKGGIAVVKIRKGSRADLLNAQAGGLLREGDVVLSVGGVPVESRAQIINHFKKNPVPSGQKLNVVISRYGKKVNKTIVVPKR